MSARALRRLPLRGWLGLALVASAWTANELLGGLRTQFLFFPLWLGFVLALDGWTERRDGCSLGTRSRAGFVRLFLISIPLWWLFEAANERIGNWEYLGRERFGELEYALFCSLSFTTVVPAVLVSARWARRLAWIERLGPGPVLAPTRGLRRALLPIGLALLAATLLWPRACYPLLWVSAVFLLEPLLLARGRRALLTDLARGDWRPWLALWVGGTLCGVAWELWNYHSYPKWIYHTPGVGGPKLFEMPLPGYLGYWPFALAVYQWKELWLREPELLVDRDGERERTRALEVRA